MTQTVDPLSSLGIAETVFSQMGGKNRLTMMIGATYWMHNQRGDNEIDAIFQFSARNAKKANLCIVTYFRVPDCYVMKIYRQVEGSKRNQWIASRTKLYESPQIYCDQLIDTFERNTGLYLHL